MLRAFESQHLTDRLVRLSTSVRYDDLNKYALDRLAGVEDKRGSVGEDAAARTKVLDPKTCQILVAPIQNLLS